MKIKFIQIVLAVCLLWFIFNAFNSYDNTDDIINEKRSGLLVYTDHFTGCQYLKAGYFGSIIPRLDRNGKHIGCEK